MPGLGVGVGVRKEGCNGVGIHFALISIGAQAAGDGNQPLVRMQRTSPVWLHQTDREWDSWHWAQLCHQSQAKSKHTVFGCQNHLSEERMDNLWYRERETEWKQGILGKGQKRKRVDYWVKGLLEWMATLCNAQGFKGPVLCSGSVVVDSFSCVITVVTIMLTSTTREILVKKNVTQTFTHKWNYSHWPTVIVSLWHDCLSSLVFNRPGRIPNSEAIFSISKNTRPRESCGDH